MDKRFECGRMLDEYKNKILDQAESLVSNCFPEKILLLDAISKSPVFSTADLSIFRSDLNVTAPRRSSHIRRNDRTLSRNQRLRSCGDSLDVEEEDDDDDSRDPIIPSNRHLISIIDQVKPHIQELIENIHVLKMWILLLIPKIEDGNNFGVEIQEDTLTVIEAIETAATSHLKKISKYFLDRGDIVIKMADDPYVEDYKRAVMELDEKEFLRIRRIIRDLRNYYAHLHNLISLNLGKIKRPRTSNSENLY